MNKIKNILKSKVTMVALACLLLVGVFAGITALATETKATPEITAINVNHGGNISLLYDVTISGLDAPITSKDGFEMKFWSSKPANAAAEANYVAPAEDIDIGADTYKNGQQTFTVASITFAPKDMNKVIFAAACYNGEYSDVVEYSVFEYLCAASIADGVTADQQALYETMKDYINYAREYLNWTEGISIDDYGYIEVNNGYIIKMVKGADNSVTWDTETHFESGLYPIGATLKVVSDYDQARWINRDGDIMEINDDGVLNDNSYKFELEAKDSIRRYTSYPATYISMATEGYELLKVNVGVKENEPMYTPAGYSTTANGNEFLAANLPGEERYVISAPLFDADGVMFSHWEKDGVVLTTSTLLDVDYDAIDFTAAKTAYEVDATPVYDNATADRTIALNTATGDDNTYDVVTNLEGGGVTVDSTTRPSGETPEGKPAKFTGVPTGDTISGAERYVYSMDVKYETATGKTEGITMADCFSSPSNPVMNQIRVGHGDVNYSFLYLYVYANTPDEDKATSAVTGWHIELSANSVGANRYSFANDDRINDLSFGEEHNLTFFIDVEKSGSDYVQKGVSLYVDGIYAGTAKCVPERSETFPYTNNNVYVNWSALMKTKTKVTITNMKVEEYVAD